MTPQNGSNIPSLNEVERMYIITKWRIAHLTDAELLKLSDPELFWLAIVMDERGNPRQFTEVLNTLNQRQVPPGGQTTPAPSTPSTPSTPPVEPDDLSNPFESARRLRAAVIGQIQIPAPSAVRN